MAAVRKSVSDTFAREDAPQPLDRTPRCHARRAWHERRHLRVWRSRCPAGAWLRGATSSGSSGQHAARRNEIRRRKARPEEAPARRKRQHWTSELRRQLLHRRPQKEI